MENRYDDEITIDLVDMIFFFLKKWRSMIVVVLIGALLGGLWALLPPSLMEEEDLEDTSIVNMEKAQENRKLHALKEEYNNESLMMTMDLENLHRGTLSYHVSADKDLNMVQAEYNSLLTDELYEQFRQVSGYDVDLKYIRELIGYGVEIVTDNRGDNSTATLNITCSVTADSEEKCIAMLDLFRSKIEEMQKSMPWRYANYKDIKTMDMVAPLDSDWYEQNRINNESAMNGYMEAAVEFEETMSDDELYYYTIVMLGIEPEEPGLGHYAKKIIIVAFLAGVLWAVWFLVKYLTDRNIKTVAEAENISGLLLLGRVKSEKDLKGIDKWLDGIQEKTRNILDETSYVAAVIDSRKEGEAVLCGNRKAEEVCRIMGELSQGCTGLIPCDFTHYSVKSLQKAKTVGQAILVVRTGKTKKAELLRELELCKMQNVKVLGMVVAD